MPGRGPQSLKKRQKEQQRREKQQEKMAKRLERRRQSADAPSELTSETVPDEQATSGDSQPVG